MSIIEPKKQRTINQCINLGKARICGHRKKVMTCKELRGRGHNNTLLNTLLYNTYQGRKHTENTATRIVSVYKTVQRSRAESWQSHYCNHARLSCLHLVSVLYPSFHLLSQPILIWDPADGFGHDNWIPSVVEAAPSDPTSANRVDYASEGSLIRGCCDRQYNQSCPLFPHPSTPNRK